MAVHISEIGVRIAVGSGDGLPPQGGGGGGTGDSSCGDARLSDAELETIVQQAVVRVLETLRMQESR